MSSAEMKASIAKKYAEQERVRWTGETIPDWALLTPEEQAYLKGTYGPTPKYSEEQLGDYDDYIATLKTPEGASLPIVKDIGEYLERREELIVDYTRGYSEEQLREYNLWIDWSQKYGELGDWLPTNITDWLANYDQAQQQLDKWKQQATTEELEQLELEQYALDPAEAARRREEAYREARYAAKERFREPARLSEAFTGWMERQGQLSGAFTQFVESEYPSLRGEFEAGLPRPVGYPTREAARAEAARRERGFEAWLPKQMPEVREEYWSQRPAARGERLWMQQPTLRAVNW